MILYEQGLAKYGLTLVQVLLTEDDFARRKRYLNLRHTLMTLLEMGVIPVINENDTVSTSELEITDRSRSFGDNDKLSALVMSKLEATLLVLLSDVDGLFTEDPRENPDAQFIREVRESPPILKHSPAANRAGDAEAWKPNFKRRVLRSIRAEWPLSPT